MRPMKKQPLTFTRKVPNGNVDGRCSWIMREARNLEILPRNPPVPTRRSVLNILKISAGFQIIEQYAHYLAIKLKVSIVHYECSKYFYFELFGKAMNGFIKFEVKRIN
jgi:hypothetical protein